MTDTVKLLRNDRVAIDKTYYKQSGKKGPISPEILQATINGIQDARDGVEMQYGTIYHANGVVTRSATQQAAA